MKPMGTNLIVSPVIVARKARIVGADGEAIDMSLFCPSSLDVSHDRVSLVVANGTRCKGVAKPGDFVLHSPYAPVEHEWLGKNRLLEEDEIDLVFKKEVAS